MYQSMQQILLGSIGRNISDYAMECQVKFSKQDRESIRDRMLYSYKVMKDAVHAGLNDSLRSMSGLTGGQAKKLFKAAQNGVLASDGMLALAAMRALSTAEHNAAMGKIVAAPTAGACGILPAALISMQEKYGLSDEKIVSGLLTAGAIGAVVAHRASISGAQGGCQAECGTAAAMAAAAMVELRGGSPEQALYAAGFAIMNCMGLVCDPVHGLVEVPCVYRNVAGIANALVAADLALAGIVCPLPVDELVDAMKAVGDSMPCSLRETGEGGCAACPSVAAQDIFAT